MNRDSGKNFGVPSSGSPPSEAWLFAQEILGKPISRVVNPAATASAERQQLEGLAQFSTRHATELRQLQSAEVEASRERQLLEWAAKISPHAATKLRAIEREEAEAREASRRAQEFAESLLEGNWDPSKHPRAPRGQSDGGQWVATGGGGGAGGIAAAVPFTPFQTTGFHQGQATSRLAAFDGAAPSTWPTTGSASSLLPKVGSGAGAGAGAAAGIGAGAFLGGVRNASVGPYWARVPGVKAMPQIWVYELEKRVRAGALSRDDAVQIFNTAVFGAEAQKFAPTGGTMSAVHKSATDFLGKAEAVYFAKKKKEQGWATQPGGYQQSGGRVFPTKRNSGLDGYALRKEQEEFFERGLAQGHDPGYLRGQAIVAGEGRTGSDPDHLDDPELEAALQRAIKRSRKPAK